MRVRACVHVRACRWRRDGFGDDALQPYTGIWRRLPPRDHAIPNSGRHEYRSAGEAVRAGGDRTGAHEAAAEGDVDVGAAGRGAALSRAAAARDGCGGGVWGAAGQRCGVLAGV
eukprot:ctg_4520.g635